MRQLKRPVKSSVFVRGRGMSESAGDIVDRVVSR